MRLVPCGLNSSRSPSDKPTTSLRPRSKPKEPSNAPTVRRRVVLVMGVINFLVEKFVSVATPFILFRHTHCLNCYETGKLVSMAESLESDFRKLSCSFFRSPLKHPPLWGVIIGLADSTTSLSAFNCASHCRIVSRENSARLLAVDNNNFMGLCFITVFYFRFDLKIMACPSPSFPSRSWQPIPATRKAINIR